MKPWPPQNSISPSTGQKVSGTHPHWAALGQVAEEKALLAQVGPSKLITAV